MIFDVPRISTAIRNTITPVNSAVVYNTDTNFYEYYNGTEWKIFGEGRVVTFNTRNGDVTLLDSDIAGLGDFTVSGTLTINNDIILGNEALKIMTSSTDPNVSGVAANVGSIILKNDGTIWQKLDTGNSDWSRVQTGYFTGEPTGFPIDNTGQIDRSSSVIAFNEGNRNFSIAPSGTSYSIVIKGREYRKTTTEIKQISNIEGIHYLYFDVNGELQELTTFSSDLILKDVLIATIYWDTTNSKAILFGDERHGCTMDSHTHARIHSESGAVYISGMALNNFTVDGDGSSESHLTFSANSGTFRDEDILHSLSAKSTSDSMPVLYREGSNWRSITPTITGGTYARAIGSIGTPGQIAYNQFSGGVWSRTSVSNGNYVCYHVMATNDVNKPYMVIMGTNEYLSKGDAQTGAINEISTLSGLPFVEVVFVGTILFECRTGYTNSLSAAILSVNGSNYVDWRFRSTLNPSTASINSHNSLGGIYGPSPYYHSNQPIATTDSVQFAGLNIGGNYSLPSVDGVSGQVISTNGSGSLSFTTITQNHNSLTGLQGGGGGNYYHSDQPINIASLVQFAGLNIGGNYSLPSIDGVSGQVLTTNGSGTLSFTTITQNHNSLTGLQGGGGGNYYHSNQPINISNSVQFAGLNIGGIYSFPTVDGTPGQILSTNGSGTLSFTTITQDHNSLTGLQGGGGGNYYHSNQAINTTDSPTFAGLTVNGNLNVSGTTTYLEVVNLQVKDKNIELSKIDSPSDIIADGGGITLKGDTDKTFNWVDSTDSWTSSENIDLASGKVYQINEITVLSPTQVLGKNVPVGDFVGTTDFQNISNKTLEGFYLTGDINSSGTAIDIDLINNNSSAISFDTPAKNGILEIDTTNGFETVKMSGDLAVSGTTSVTNFNASGSIVFNGLTFPNADGTAGQVISTDGNGNLFFNTGGGGGSLTYQILSAPLGTLKLGMPVYWDGTNYAPANAFTTTKIPTAIVKEINVSNYTVQFGGTLTLTNSQWNEISSGTTGLSTGAGTNVYFLSDESDGFITNISPIFSIPVLNCIKNDGTNSTVEIKFGTLSTTLLNESYSTEREVFISNGSSLNYTLTLTPYSRNTTHVTIDGATQQGDAFTISNKNIIFSESPPLNSEIEVNYLTQKNFSYANIFKHSEITSGTTTSFNLPITPSSENEVMAWVGGSYQDNSNFILNGNVLIFDTPVDTGVKVQFIIFSSVQFTDFPYIKRKTTSLIDTGTKTIINLFGNQSTGSYYFHLTNNPLISGTIRLQETNPINVRVETFSSDVSVAKDTVGKINIYINNSGNLEIQNRLGSEINIMIERHQ